MATSAPPPCGFVRPEPGVHAAHADHPIDRENWPKITIVTGIPMIANTTQFAYHSCLWKRVIGGQKSMMMMRRPLRAWYRTAAPSSHSMTIPGGVA